MRRQKGWVAPLMLGATLVVSAMMLYAVEKSRAWQRQQVLDNANSFYNRVVYLENKIKAYVTGHFQMGYPINGEQIFPYDLYQLVSRGYYPECSDADNEDGLCWKVNQTPWGELDYYDYRVHAYPDRANAQYFYAEIKYQLPNPSDPALANELRATRTLLAQLPNGRYDESTHVFTLRIDRPDKAFGYESLVKRSGDDSTLLGDWDIGGLFSITNARDYTIRNSDGTQKLVSNHLSSTLLVEDGAKIPKPSCPNNLEPKIYLSISSVGEIDHSKYRYAGGVRTYLDKDKTTALEWVVRLDVAVWEKDTNKAAVVHDGQLVITTTCS